MNMSLFRKEREAVLNATEGVRTMVMVVGIAFLFSAVALIMAIAALKAGAA